MNDIQTSIRQETMPEKITRDSRGTLIEEGLRVAYNFQGSVKIGKILSFSSRWRVVRPDKIPTAWWACKFEMKVLNESGHTSTLKNPNSFVII